MHWLSVGTEDGQYSFHVEGLSKHILDDADSLRAVQRTVKNILDWARNERLPKICKLLDAYRDKFQREKAEAEAERAALAAFDSAPVNAEPRNERKQKGRKRKSSTATLTAANVEDEEPRLAPP